MLSPSMGLKASSGMPEEIRSGVVPSRLLPTRMWWSRKERGPAGDERLHPKAHLAQLGSHGIDVHPVEAATDHVAQRLTRRVGRGLVVAGADGGQTPGHAVGGGDQEVPATDRRVADLEVQDRRLRVRLPRGLIEHRV